MYESLADSLKVGQAQQLAEAAKKRKPTGSVTPGAGRVRVILLLFCALCSRSCLAVI